MSFLMEKLIKNDDENNNNERYELSSDLNMNEYKMLKLIGNGSYANIYLVENYSEIYSILFNKKF